MRKILIATATAFLLAGCGGGSEHPSQPAPGQPAPSGNSGPKGSHSAAYDQGYERGNQHVGDFDIGAGFGGMDCSLEAGHYDVARRDMDDWMAGCKDGVQARKQEVTGKTSTSPSIDCSKPVEGNDGGFHAINCPPGFG